MLLSILANLKSHNLHMVRQNLSKLVDDAQVRSTLRFGFGLGLGLGLGLEHFFELGLGLGLELELGSTVTRHVDRSDSTSRVSVDLSCHGGYVHVFRPRERGAIGPTYATPLMRLEDHRGVRVC